METLHPTEEQMKTFIKEMPAKTPFVMLNMLKFRDKARYADEEKNITGVQAYEQYAKETFFHLQKVGGKAIWMGDAQIPVIAPTEKYWDKVLLVQYPSVDKFMEMTQDPEYIKSALHRTAALEDSRLIPMLETMSER